MQTISQYSRMSISDTALLFERGILYIAIQSLEVSKEDCATSRVRKSGMGCAILEMRAKVWIPSLHCAILGLRKFLVCAEHKYPLLLV